MEKSRDGNGIWLHKWCGQHVFFFIRQFGRLHNKAGSKVIQDLIVFASNRHGTICTLANCPRNGATFNEVKSMRSEHFKQGNFSGQSFVGCTINKHRYSHSSEKTNCQEDYVFKAIINITSVIKFCYSHFISGQVRNIEWKNWLVSSHLPCITSCIFVLVLVSQPTCGLYVEVSMQLIDEHVVNVKLLTVELQAQVTKSFHLKQRAF